MSNNNELIRLKCLSQITAKLQGYTGLAKTQSTCAKHSQDICTSEFRREGWNTSTFFSLCNNLCLGSFPRCDLIITRRRAGSWDIFYFCVPPWQGYKRDWHRIIVNIMAGAVRQPIDVSSLSAYIAKEVHDVKLPISIKQVCSNPTNQLLEISLNYN